MIGIREIERALVETGTSQSSAEAHFEALGVDPDAAAMAMGAMARSAIEEIAAKMEPGGVIRLGEDVGMRFAEVALSAFLVGIVLGREAAIGQEDPR